MKVTFWTGINILNWICLISWTLWAQPSARWPVNWCWLVCIQNCCKYSKQHFHKSIFNVTTSDCMVSLLLLMFTKLFKLRTVNCEQLNNIVYAIIALQGKSANSLSFSFVIIIILLTIFNANETLRRSTMKSKDSCITDPKPNKTSLLCCISNIPNIHMNIVVWEMRNVRRHFQQRNHSMISDSLGFSVLQLTVYLVYTVHNIVRYNSHLILNKQLKRYVNIHLHFKLFHETHSNAYNILTRK